MTPDVGSRKKAAIERFVQLLDKPGLVNLLDTFLTYETFPQTQESLGEFTGLHQGSVSKRVNELVELGIVEEIDGTRPQEYRLNMDYPAAQGLVDTHTELHNYVREIQRASEEFDPDQAESHEGSPFVELFRYRTNVKILSAFLLFPEERFEIKHISNKAGVDQSTVRDNIDVLCRVGIIERIESQLRDTTEYELNSDHPAKDGFLEVIESLQSDEPTLPADKEELTTPTNGMRLDRVRQQIAELLEGTETADIKPQITKEWTDTRSEIMESYSLQLDAGKLAEELDEDTQDSTSDTKTEQECIACKLEEREVSSGEYHISGQISATAA